MFIDIVSMVWLLWNLHAVPTNSTIFILFTKTQSEILKSTNQLPNFQIKFFKNKNIDIIINII